MRFTTYFAEPGIIPYPVTTSCFATTAIKSYNFITKFDKIIADAGLNL
jgi:hypothetical protein